MVHAHPYSPLVSPSRDTWVWTLCQARTDITRHMLTLPVEGRDREKGRPAAALAPWVTDLEAWSPEMPVLLG